MCVHVRACKCVHMVCGCICSVCMCICVICVCSVCMLYVCVVCVCTCVVCVNIYMHVCMCLCMCGVCLCVLIAVFDAHRLSDDKDPFPWLPGVHIDFLPVTHKLSPENLDILQLLEE